MKKEFNGRSAFFTSVTPLLERCVRCDKIISLEFLSHSFKQRLHRSKSGTTAHPHSTVVPLFENKKKQNEYSSVLRDSADTPLQKRNNRSRTSHELRQSLENPKKKKKPPVEWKESFLSLPTAFDTSAPVDATDDDGAEASAVALVGVHQAAAHEWARVTGHDSISHDLRLLSWRPRDFLGDPATNRSSDLQCSNGDCTADADFD